MQNYVDGGLSYHKPAMLVLSATNAVPTMSFHIFGPPKGRSYEFSAVSQSVSDAIPGNLVQEIF